MNKKKYYSIFFIALFLSILPLCKLAAQEQTEDTHAHASSLKWKGIDVSTVIGNDNYKPNEGGNSNSISTYPFNKGKTIFLYNVGTGRFIIEGGNFGMEGRLFHETFGRPLYLFSDGYILSGILENNNAKFIFGCNVPSVFHSQSNWNNWDQFSFTIMMDTDKSKRTKGWQFQRVPGETGDTYTYYMYEDKGGKQYYLGAAWGECHAPAWKGNGQLVFMDDDRATWTTYDPRGKTEKYEVNGDMITLDELYQWRLVDEDEFKSMLDNEEIGLNPSISIFITDRDFTRNSQVFNESWFVEEKTGADYSEKHRLGFTYGSSNNSNGKTKQKEYNNNEAWNKPIRLKHVFDGEHLTDGTLKAQYGWKNAKYGFLTFEGVGRTYTEVEVPRAGWYLVQCYGFVQSDEGHDAYLFARVKDSEETSSTGGYSEIALHTVAAGTYTGKDNKDNCLVVGNELTKNGENYKNTVWICVTEEQFNSGVTTLQIGVGKDQATRSAVTTSSGKNYYYDTDWVCVDDFRMSYLGLRPAFFYEEEENLNYLDPTSSDYIDSETNKAKQYQGASPTGQYAGAICIERSLKTNQWNSFSFPMPLTGEQIRYAFGEDAKLAYIHSVGKMSQHENVIDFKSVTLRTTDPVVLPGHFYLLKPTKLPAKNYDPLGREREYYELGRKYFSVKANEAADYTHFKLPTTKLMEDTEETIESLDGNHDGKASVNYVRTPGYKSFSVSGGIYTGTTAQGIYATKGSYAVSNNTIYHLARDTPLKGFRGWITLDNPVNQQAKDFSMEVFGIFDKEPVSIATGAELPRIQILDNDESVYDLTGRKVGTLGFSLPKGMYIVRGKKFLVK